MVDTECLRCVELFVLETLSTILYFYGSTWTEQSGIMHITQYAYPNASRDKNLLLTNESTIISREKKNTKFGVQFVLLERVRSAKNDMISASTCRYHFYPISID